MSLLTVASVPHPVGGVVQNLKFIGVKEQGTIIIFGETINGQKMGFKGLYMKKVTEVKMPEEVGIPEPT